jgi:CrcB protein
MALGSFIAVGGGAAIGAWLRWWLGIVLNPIFPTLPLGTLAANVLGGFLMGVAMALLTHFEAMPPALRLLMTTGFLGGLTTFSTFSAETATLITRGQPGWTAIIIAAHVIGSVLMRLLGVVAAELVLNALWNRA